MAFSSAFVKPFRPAFDAGLAAAVVTLTLQPDAAAGVDVLLHKYDPGGFFGNYASCRVNDTWANTLIRFDLSSIPSGAIVIDASLTLWVSYVSAATGTVTLHRILAANADWSESSNWNYAIPSYRRWAGDVGANGGDDAGCWISGTDYNATPIASVTKTVDEPVDTEVIFALSVTQVQALLTANYGFALRSAGVDALYWSSDHTVASKRPRLIINYR